LKALARIIVLFMVSFFCNQSIAQGYLEFVENKGQWDKQIQFKGDLTTGSFALTASGGYRLLLYNPADLVKLRIHHDHSVPTGGGSNAKQIQSISTNSKTTPAVNTAATNLRGHVYEVSFLNANPHPVGVPDKPLKTYNNYFIGNDPQKWASHCQLYNAVTYKEIYPNIDVRYYSDQGKLKYDFIVHPGGDPNQISLLVNGADGLKISSENLIIKNSAQDVTELKPTTYQLTSIGKKDISCKYVIKGNIIRIQLNEPINPRETLVIDPLIFSTFTGSTADNWGYTATYDRRGNFYAGGIAFGNGFPVTNGAFSTTFNGGTAIGRDAGFDIAIMKFNATGTDRIYATYLGGNGNEQPHSLIVDNNYNLVIAGRTGSSNYPGTRMGTGGGWDIILSKLNADGTALIGSRVIGGNGDDGVNIVDKESNTGVKGKGLDRDYGDDSRSEVIVDSVNNIYLSSCTQSTNFPVSANAAQPKPGGTSLTSNRFQDAVVLKFNPDLSTNLFSTYLGGSEDDAAFVLALSPFTNDLFVAGATASTDFPGDKTGAFQSIYQGGMADGFIAWFSNSGTLKKTTYYGTPNGGDIIYGIQFDKFSFPYIMGTTTQTFPVVNATFSQPNSKQFIAKFQKDLSSLVFATNFGSSSTIPNISPTAFLVDRCENIYVSGWGGLGNTKVGYESAGTKNLLTTADAIKQTTDGSDFYFLVIDKTASNLLYGSFFGQDDTNSGWPDHVDGGTSRFDRNGIIYQAVCGNCYGGARFPTSAGAYSQQNGTGTNGCNLAAIKIAFNQAGVSSDLVSSINGNVGDTSGCVPLTVTFEDAFSMGTSYIWDYGDGSKRDTTVAPKTSHTFLTPNLYQVKLISIDSSKCNIADSSIINIHVRSDKAILNFKPNKVGSCNSLIYDFVNQSIPPASPSKPFSAKSFTWIFGDGTTKVAGTETVQHAYAAPGTYDVKLVLSDTNYCNKFDTLSLQLHIAGTIKASYTTPAVGCGLYSAVFNNTSLGGSDFIWDFGDGSPTSTQTNPTHVYTNTGKYIITLIANDPNSCNLTDKFIDSITVIPGPTAFYTYTPNPTIPNTAVVFSNKSIGANNYKWVYGDGDSVLTSRIDTTISHIYAATGTFNTCLIASNNVGCSATYCEPISVTINPGCDVPNAFTPNGDGTNDRIYVRGYGIAQMTWRIYDRWGNMVYASADPTQGWDGTYKGKLLAQDVYHYTLQVVFSNKDSFVKKGDITLLR
jgi:gliding motility-associated-like protein